MLTLKTIKKRRNKDNFRLFCIKEFYKTQYYKTLDLAMVVLRIDLSNLDIRYTNIRRSFFSILPILNITLLNCKRH